MNEKPGSSLESVHENLIGAALFEQPVGLSKDSFERIRGVLWHSGKVMISRLHEFYITETEFKNPLNFVNNFSELSVELVEEAREEVKSKKAKVKNNLPSPPGACPTPVGRGAGGEGNGSPGKYEPKLKVQTFLKVNTVSIIIQDNGKGIPDEIKEKVLQPFFTTKKGTAGTGLGLSITNDIVKAHRGKLEVESTRGKGTECTIHLQKPGLHES